MSLLRLLLDRGFSIGKTIRFRVPQRTRGGGRGGRMPAPPRTAGVPPASSPVAPALLAGVLPDTPSEKDISKADKPR